MHAFESKPGTHDPSAGPTADVEFDAGPMGCGELVLELRFRMLDMHPGQVLLLTALDSGAREDLPSWCRMTGHRLLYSNHPLYWIQRKDT